MINSNKREYLNNEYKLDLINQDLLNKNNKELYQSIKEVSNKQNLIFANIINTFDGRKIKFMKSNILKSKLEFKDDFIKLFEQGKSIDSISMELGLSISRAYN